MLKAYHTHQGRGPLFLLVHCNPYHCRWPYPVGVRNGLPESTLKSLETLGFIRQKRTLTHRYACKTDLNQLLDDVGHRKVLILVYITFLRSSLSRKWGARGRKIHADLAPEDDGHDITTNASWQVVCYINRNGNSIKHRL